ncbi:DUF4258 domain-containing protein [Lacinutrix sp. Bg11-31]|uniref:DUF4258 domain-containing protein n=1 Tax=Lacinutrix sp. Bg11-31 TaxID=2057808 RepID=UPI000C30EEF6|nr:DUF4258 domain-containing protein [Lacinutrix sp. Bg11-31]AUC81339.1 hypothetical protein CW733_04005 [Lacinutrix sp. Bg11-31]
MSLLKRFGYYFGGFAIGLVLLAFFLNGKKASCDYGPDARVLKNIRNKPLVYSEKATVFMSSKKIDTTKINYILFKGDINFSKSDTRKKPCGIYFVEGNIDGLDTGVLVENCEKTATIYSVEFLD